MIKLSEKIKIKIRFCPNCMGSKIRTYHEEEELNRGRNKAWKRVMYWVPMIWCHDCKKHSAAFEWVKAKHDAVLVAMGGMTIQEMKDLRKGLGFKNAVGFARYLGVGDSTVKRWESRSGYPSTAHRMLLKLAASGVDLSAVKNCNRNQSGG